MEKVVGSVNYLIWWQISDKYPSLVKVCEIMAKLICSASITLNATTIDLSIVL